MLFLHLLWIIFYFLLLFPLFHVIICTEEKKTEMGYALDFSIASSETLERALYERLEAIRLARNITQRQLAHEAGISLKTIGRLARGEGVSLNTFIRVLIALKLQDTLATLLPDPTVNPMERITKKPVEGRKRARRANTGVKSQSWSWGDTGVTNDN